MKPLDDIEKFFLMPKKRDADELPYHKKGPGNRYVMIDERIFPNCTHYCAVRYIPNCENPDPHIELHSHNVDSFYLFLGNNPDLKGLHVEVQIQNTVKHIESPATIFIPKGVMHKADVLSGSGFFVCLILSDKYKTSS